MSVLVGEEIHLPESFFYVSLRKPNTCLQPDVEHTKIGNNDLQCV